MCGQDEAVSHSQNRLDVSFHAGFLDSWHDPPFTNVHSYETVISALNIFLKITKHKKHSAQIQIKMLAGKLLL